MGESNRGDSSFCGRLNFRSSEGDLDVSYSVASILFVREYIFNSDSIPAGRVGDHPHLN